jgi:hypothetical protein
VLPQQAWASAPQATHVPLEHVAPAAQASFAQQAEPFAPQLTHNSLTQMACAELQTWPGQQYVFTSPHIGPIGFPAIPNMPAVPAMFGTPAPPVVAPPFPDDGTPPSRDERPPAVTVSLPAAPFWLPPWSLPDPPPFAAPPAPPSVVCDVAFLSWPDAFTSFISAHEPSAQTWFFRQSVFA